MMRLTNADITYVNNRIHQRNCAARYNSAEEKQFTHFAATGMLSMWNPLKTQLNQLQKSIVEGYFNILFDIFDEHPIDVKINILQTIKKTYVSDEAICYFKEKDIWCTILEVRNILNHECPQNRYQGNANAFSQEYLKGRSPITLEEIEACETGVYNSIVYYYSSGFGSTIYKEPKGIFGLTGRNKIAPPKSSQFYLLEELPTYKKYSLVLKNSIVITNKYYEFKHNTSNHKIDFFYINNEGVHKKINIDEIKVLEKELETLGLLSLLFEKSKTLISLDEKLNKIDNNKTFNEKVADKFKTRIVEHSDLGLPEITKNDVFLYIYELVESKLQNCLLEQNKYVSMNQKESQIGLPREIGLYIGKFFDRKTASNIAQTCKSAYSLACSERESYIKNNGKSYKVKPYQAYIDFF